MPHGKTRGRYLEHTLSRPYTTNPENRYNRVHKIKLVRYIHICMNSENVYIYT